MFAIGWRWDKDKEEWYFWTEHGILAREEIKERYVQKENRKPRKSNRKRHRDDYIQ